MPLPVFVGYRIVWFLYILAWLIATLIFQAPAGRDGARWLIWLTNQSYILLVLGTGAITTLTVVYTIVHYTDRQKLQRFHPQPATTLHAILRQDNIQWYMKICWFLYIVGASMAMVVVVGYWGFVFDYNCVPSMTANSTVNCLVADVYSIHLHAINGVLVILDLYLSRFPYQLFHTFYPSIFTILWVIFSAIYFAAGGTNPLDEGPYIYPVLDYGTNPGAAVGFAIVLIIGPVIAFIGLFVLAWIRDAIYSRISCCFREFHKEMSDSESQELEVV